MFQILDIEFGKYFMEREHGQQIWLIVPIHLSFKMSLKNFTTQQNTENKQLWHLDKNHNTKH